MAKPTATDEFQRLWNETAFYTDTPQYRIYKKLYAAGADFHYIRFLEGVFHLVRHFDPVIYGTQLRLSRKRKLKAASKRGFTVELYERDMNRVEQMIECDQHPMAIAAEIASTLEQLGRLGDARILKLYLAGARHLLQSRVHMNCGSIQHQLANSTSTEDRRVAPQLFAAFLRISEISAQIAERFFHLPKKGRQTDFLGNFILLAVTEHLREKRPGRPRYGLAVEFWMALSGEKKKITATSARVRAHKLKRQQQELLSFVNQRYLLLQTIGNSFTTEIAPN